MRLLVSRSGLHTADRVCTNAREAKRVLNECPVTSLLLGYDMTGRENGLDVLVWASKRDRLPVQVSLIDTNRQAVTVMGNILKSKGYKTADNREFIKH